EDEEEALGSHCRAHEDGRPFLISAAPPALPCGRAPGREGADHADASRGRARKARRPRRRTDRAPRHQRRDQVLSRRRLVAARPPLRDRAARARLRRDKRRTRARAAARCRREDREGGIAMAIAESRDTSVIESVERIREADPGDMLSRIKDLSKQVRDAWAIASKATIAPAYSEVRDLVVAGLGVCVMGGHLAATS